MVSSFRALTGIFAASVMPISLALIGDLFPVEKRQMAIGTFMGIAFLGQGLSMITGGAIGAALGGKIASAYGFSNLFLTYGLMLVLTLAASFSLIKKEKFSIVTKPHTSRFQER